MLIAEGFSLKEVSEYLGHCDIGTTANIYGHLQYKAKVGMVSHMDELFVQDVVVENPLDISLDMAQK